MLLKDVLCVVKSPQEFRAPKNGGNTRLPISRTAAGAPIALQPRLSQMLIAENAVRKSSMKEESFISMIVSLEIEMEVKR